MNAIIFNNYINHINGAVIDFIEYYLCILEQNKNIKLLILNYNQTFKEILFNLIEDRYDLGDLNFKDNIIGITKSDLLKTKFHRVLIVDYGTIQKVKGLINILNAESKIIILSDLHTDKPDYIINKTLYPKNCVLYYGEMPFVYKDVEYKHKFLFSKYRKIENVEPNIFLHSPKNNDYKFIENYKTIFKTKKIIYKTESHKKHLFSLFDTFVYYHADKWFDPRPRLMHECEFYNKRIYYINEPRCIDGSYYRYLDLKNNHLNNRFLTKDDEIVSQFI
jgi:hypothetical protein